MKADHFEQQKLLDLAAEDVALTQLAHRRATLPEVAAAVIAGLAGSALGYAAAWPVVVEVFEADWSVDWAGVATLVVGAAALATAGGLAAAQHALARRPAPVLRAE